ncbi:hypothetical protein D3C83_49180 [compost metagenome]
MSAPKAQKLPGRSGTTTREISSSSAMKAACIGPAPPKAISANSRGSWPRATEISLMALTMRATAMRRMPSAA